jgi:hypothetical protein
LKEEIKEFDKDENAETVDDRTVPANTLDQWYSTFFVRVPPDIISLQLCTPKVVGA